MDEIMGKNGDLLLDSGAVPTVSDRNNYSDETKESDVVPTDSRETNVTQPDISAMKPVHSNTSHNNSGVPYHPGASKMSHLSRRSEGRPDITGVGHVAPILIRLQGHKFAPTCGCNIIGTCEKLEKQYFRLTSDPNPSLVRPEDVLKKSFKHVFDTFMKSRSYRYIEEQLRSIRQDIQVQHLRSPFVVKLYATNARLALVHGDLDQFNQCQTQLMQLHHQHVAGFSQFQSEFECYYLLYLSMQNMHMDILRYMRTVLKSDFRRSAYYRYATCIRIALAAGNFVDYFKMADTSGIDDDKSLSDIYREAFPSVDSSETTTTPDKYIMDDCMTITSPPFYCKFLFKMFESRFRMSALVNMTRYMNYNYCSYILTLSTALYLSIETIKNALNFGTLEECVSFIRDNRGTLNSNGFLDCKRSLDDFMSSPLLRNKKL